MLLEEGRPTEMDSTRLPGKTMKKVLGKPLIELLLKRLSLSKKLKKIVSTKKTIPVYIILLCPYLLINDAVNKEGKNIDKICA